MKKTNESAVSPYSVSPYIKRRAVYSAYTVYVNSSLIIYYSVTKRSIPLQTRISVKDVPGTCVGNGSALRRFALVTSAGNGPSLRLVRTRY